MMHTGNAKPAAQVAGTGQAALPVRVRMGPPLVPGEGCGPDGAQDCE